MTLPIVATLVLVSRAGGADDVLRARLQQLEQKLAGVTDISADFEEQKFSTLLRKPMVSRGTVKVKGDHARWDTLEPRATTMLTSPQDVRIYLPHSQTLEVYPIMESLQPVVVSPIPRLATIERSFTISSGGSIPAGELSIVLTPREKRMLEFISEVLVEIDESTGFARRVEMRGPEGDRTVLVFVNVRINSGLSDSDVAFIPPPETKVVHPLSHGPAERAAASGSKGDR
jgi:outer membrane lipoprotein-sorting protein